MADRFQAYAVLLGILALAGCAGPVSKQCVARADGAANPGLMVSAQTPPGVYGVSNPDIGYAPANSFPPGAAGVDGRCM